MKKLKFTVRLEIVAAVAALFISLGSAASAAQLWYDGFDLQRAAPTWQAARWVVNPAVVERF